MHAILIEALSEERRIFIGVLQRLFHLFQLKRGNLVARGDFDRFELFLAWRQVFHGLLPESCRPKMGTFYMRERCRQWPIWSLARYEANVVDPGHAPLSR